MTRTIITLEDSDKRWLDRYSGRHKQSTAETIRHAIKEFQIKIKEREYHRVLKNTAGLLNGSDDSVRFVRKLRGEWD
jgi:hypothetical protein